MIEHKHINKIILLFFIIVAQLCWTTYNFIFEKQGCHSDEIWSYGLANSYYQPHIYLDNNISQYDEAPEYIINHNEWTDGSIYKDYLVVNDGERFSYDSVYYNQTKDVHPPLSYILLHTVCSFFPNTFSFYFAFILNCLYMIVIQIFLFKLSKALTDYNTALLVCLFYGASVGALGTVIYLRQYALLTMFGVMLTYFNVKLKQSDYTKTRLYLPAIFLTSLGGFLTQYTFLAYAGALTACFCVYLLCRKKIKKMFNYGFTMIGAVLGLIIIYPTFITQAIGYYDLRKLDLYSQFKLMLGKITYPLFGKGISAFRSATYAYVIAVIIILATVIVPLAFLFRKESWFINFKLKIKSALCAIKDVLKHYSICYIFIAISVLILCLFVANTTNVSAMGAYVARYIMLVYPLVSLIFIGTIYFIISQLPKIQKILTLFVLAVTIVISIYTNIVVENPYLFKQPENALDLKGILKNKNCVLVEAKDTNWLLTCFIPYFTQTNKVFNTTEYGFYNNIEKINSIDHVDYILIPESAIFKNQETIKDFMGQVIDLNNPPASTEIDINEYNKEISEYAETLSVLNNGCYAKEISTYNFQGFIYHLFKLT